MSRAISRTLNWRQRLFISAFLNDPKANAVNAAKVAGYRRPHQMAEILFKNPLVRWAVESKMRSCALQADEALARYSEIAQFDLGEFIEFEEDEKGRRKPYFNLERMKKAGKTHIIKKLKILPDGSIELDTHSSQDALDKLAKYHGLFRERIEFGGLGTSEPGASDRVVAIIQGLTHISRTMLLGATHSTNEPCYVRDGGEPISVGASETFTLPEPETPGRSGGTDT